MPDSPLQIHAQLEQLRQKPPLLVGRERELAVLRQHIVARRPVFLRGAAGVGKTALLSALYATWPAAEPRPDVVLFYCGASRTRRQIATHLLVNLLRHRGRLQSEYVERRKTISSLGALQRFTASEALPALKRMMHQNLARDRACLILDHLDYADPKIASLLEVWLEDTPLILVAGDADRLGRARWLLSSVEHLELGTLDRSALLQIARLVAADQPLAEADLREAVGRAAGNAGQLCRLLRATTRSQYRRNGRLQWKLVELDLRIRAIGLSDARDRSRGVA